MYNRILAPLDGSATSEHSLKHLEELVSGCRVSQIVLLTVLEKSAPPVLEYGSQSQVNAIYSQWENEQQKVRDIALSYLNGIAEKLKNQGVEVQTEAVQEEPGKSVAEVILDYADNHAIDLIVMSTHGRSGVTRWAFGSVADRVVRHSRVPVLTIAPAGAR